MAYEQYSKIREKVIGRDCGKCVKCGSTNKLQVHHLNLSNYYYEDHAEGNLITLCIYCHKSLHAKKWKLEDIGIITPAESTNTLKPEHYNFTDEHWDKLFEEKPII